MDWIQSGIRGLFHPEMGCAKASVRCPRGASGAQKLPRCATRGTPGAQKIPRGTIWGTPGAQKNPRGAKNIQGCKNFPVAQKNAQEHKTFPGAQKIPRGTTRSPRKAQGHPKRTSGVQKIHKSTSGAQLESVVFFIQFYNLQEHKKHPGVPRYISFMTRCAFG